MPSTRVSISSLRCGSKFLFECFKILFLKKLKFQTHKSSITLPQLSWRVTVPHRTPSWSQPVTTTGKFAYFLVNIRTLFYNQIFSQIWIDDSAEAPGVQGLGATYNTFIVWANGDGFSPDNMCRHPYSGAYYKVFPTIKQCKVFQSSMVFVVQIRER